MKKYFITFFLLFPILLSAQLTENQKETVIYEMEAYRNVIDANLTKDGNTLSLAIIANYSTSENKAKQLGESFVRLCISLIEYNSPGGNEIGRSDYDYLVGVYKPNKDEIALGAKSSIARWITW